MCPYFTLEILLTTGRISECYRWHNYVTQNAVRNIVFVIVASAIYMQVKPVYSGNTGVILEHIPMERSKSNTINVNGK